MATTLNLTIEQGANLSQVITVGTTYNGRTPSAKIRDRFGGTLLTSPSCTAVSAGDTTISLTAAQTAALSAPAYARDDERNVVIGYWELTDTNAGVVTRLRQGTVTLSRQVSA
jgi:hypothetical protein